MRALTTSERLSEAYASSAMKSSEMPQIFGQKTCVIKIDDGRLNYGRLEAREQSAQNRGRSGEACGVGGGRSREYGAWKWRVVTMTDRRRNEAEPPLVADFYVMRRLVVPTPMTSR